ncbi:hypothetical protein APHAL10511_001966 [Amanita phalloides]|nr:hypothetical protein APHAL10511_001966 [Amanita phalloides]
MAASRGYINIVSWLIEDSGAMPDLEDREGETALHKASLHGHLNVVQYLIERGADVRVQDSDGWTALHNACSKGYLDIIRWLCEKGELVVRIDGLSGIDISNKDGWTPLMNASSKGHLPIVLYLIRQAADPLIRNKWGETAYDVAAAVFQVCICEVLRQAEEEHWRGCQIPYSPLAVHMTLPVIVYENEKLDTRLKTLAVSGPKFSASNLGRPGRRPPFELNFPKSDPAGVMAVTAWSDIQLPFCNSPWAFPPPGKPEKQTADGDYRSHFWLSEWIVDVSHPRVDARNGWQYAHQFTDVDDQWSAERPPSLERLVNDGGIVSSSVRTPQHWVRRRRWVRIMRRRIDIPPLPFLQPDGSMCHLASDGGLVPYIDQESEDDSGQELRSMAPSLLSSAQDYVARARYLVGNQTNGTNTDYPSNTIAEMRRSIVKLERATDELRKGILGDEESGRKSQAEVLLNVYSRELNRLRLAAGARGWSLNEDDSDEDIDGTFQYPATGVEDYPSSSGSLSTDHMTRSGISRGPVDLTPQLSQAPEFRIPTREAPQASLSSRHILQQSGLWERDEEVSNCRDCKRRFGFLTRKHHCRKCGLIFCDNCSAFRTLLDPPLVVHEKGHVESSNSSNLQRVCRACYSDFTASLAFQNKTTSVKPVIVDVKQLSPSSFSGFFHFSFCPVCNFKIEQLSDTKVQENHVKDCLERTAKYLIYKLSVGKAPIGVECVVCFKEFAPGSSVAQLSCLCNFHDSCLTARLQRGETCPAHAR